MTPIKLQWLLDIHSYKLSCPLLLLAGTRLTLKTGVISFLPLSLPVPVKIIITYLIRVFDTTWESKFWALKFLFHVDLKAIKANDPVKKISVSYLLRFFAEGRVKVDALVSVKW